MHTWLLHGVQTTHGKVKTVERGTCVGRPVVTYPPLLALIYRS